MHPMIVLKGDGVINYQAKNAWNNFFRQPKGQDFARNYPYFLVKT
jgi:hypothetical protein